MRKYAALILALICSLLLTACGNNQPAQDTMSGELPDLLAQLYVGAGDHFGPLIDAEITDENCQSYLGLTPEQLTTYTTDNTVSVGAFTTSAHLVALLKCTDGLAAAEVKKLIQENFDSGRWICVLPEQSFVQDSGTYVLLASTNSEGAEALKQSFSELAADNLGSCDVFFTRA